MFPENTLELANLVDVGCEGCLCFMELTLKLIENGCREMGLGLFWLRRGLTDRRKRVRVARKILGLT